MRISTVILLGIFCLASARNTYDGYKVFRMWPKTEGQKNILKDLEESEDLDFWSEVKNGDFPVDIMVKPQHQHRFVTEMNKIGLDVTTFIDNVPEKIEAQKLERFSRTGMTWTAYYTLDDIYAWLDELAEQYPNQVSVEIGGSTYEGRQIKGVKISFGTGKKSVFLEGGIHAREWISPATMTYVINELLTSTDASFRRVADSFDWYIFPVTNPDGYVHTHTTTRLWRKTRTYYNILCRGADPNRNWDAHWGEQGTSSLCAMETYGGPNAFSEVETQSLSEYIRNVAPNMVAYISFHSYSQLLMVPYGHTTDHLDNYDETTLGDLRRGSGNEVTIKVALEKVAIANVAIQALASRYGTVYVAGNIAETIYRASGGSIDWVKQEFQTPLVYVYELRDLGANGFLLPANQIIPNSEETVDSLVAIFDEADKRGIVSLS